MKRSILFVLIGMVIGGGIVWFAKTPGHPDAGETHAAEEEHASSTSRDANGDVVVKMADKAQADAGIVAANAAPAEFAPEVKGYGRVADPVALAALMSELAAAQAAYAASSNELARLKTLETQGNASARALQTAEAAALRDQLAVQSVRDRLRLSWGAAVSDRTDAPAFIRSLTALETVLVRIDLPLSEVLDSPPIGARIVTLAGKSTDAEFVGTASGVDPQLQGRGFIFLIPANTVHLLGGEAVVGFARLAGDAAAGVTVPRAAVVRVDGKGWVYIRNAGNGSFTRKEIPLDHPTDTGWFVPNGVLPGNPIVVTGAQTLLSEELKASISAD